MLLLEGADVLVELRLASFLRIALPRRQEGRRTQREFRLEPALELIHRFVDELALFTFALARRMIITSFFTTLSTSPTRVAPTSTTLLATSSHRRLRSGFDEASTLQSSMGEAGLAPLDQRRHAA